LFFVTLTKYLHRINKYSARIYYRVSLGPSFLGLEEAEKRKEFFFSERT
jgi:hypothetical protein